jgi:hypothetical protein
MNFDFKQFYLSADGFLPGTPGPNRFGPPTAD